MNKLVVIVGPTASGKSALAMDIAEKFNGEIICADSRTIYKGMDIGTAKPSNEDRARVTHHLLDVVYPGEAFSAAQFKEHANNAIVDITSRGKLPIMVGGTGLYINAVIFNYQFNSPADPQTRAQYNRLSLVELHEQIQQKGIQFPTNVFNKRHLIRALEVGGVMQRSEVALRKDTLIVGISTTRQDLRKKVEQRAQLMIHQGIVEEAILLSKRYGWDNEAMTGNIYRIFKAVVDGTMGLEEAKEKFVSADMKLAKRQMTWFKRNPHIIWGTRDELEGVISRFVE